MRVPRDGLVAPGPIALVALGCDGSVTLDRDAGRARPDRRRGVTGPRAEFAPPALTESTTTG